MSRVSIRCLPSVPTVCPKTSCVYNRDTLCDDPRTNKRNSDAECCRMNNKDVLAMLPSAKSDA